MVSCFRQDRDCLANASQHGGKQTSLSSCNQPMEVQAASILMRHHSTPLNLHEECLDSHPVRLPMGQEVTAGPAMAPQFASIVCIRRGWRDMGSRNGGRHQFWAVQLSMRQEVEDGGRRLLSV